MNIPAFVSYVVVNMYTPGPNNIMSMASGGQRGYYKSLPMMLGISFGASVLFFLCGWMNLTMSEYVPKFRPIMEWIGAAYMGYLAFIILRNGKDAGEQKENKLGFVMGALMQPLNIKGVLFCITTTGSFIIPYYASYYAIVAFAVLTGVLCFSSVTLWALFGATFQKFLSKYQKPFNITMAALLVYCGVSLFL